MRLQILGLSIFNLTKYRYFFPQLSGDFDIVTGNLPYIQIQKFSGQAIQTEWQNQHYETAQYGGMFTSPLIFDESRDSQWCDFYFLGLDKFTIWNATIITAKLTLEDAAYDLAFTCTKEILSAGC
jgi:hypothetical protein